MKRPLISKRGILRWRQDLSRSGVDAAESRVAGVESGNGGGLRIDTRGHAHCGGASRIHGRPDASADACQKRSTVSSAFLGFHDLHGMPVDIGLNLTPKRRPRAASPKTDVLDGNVHFLEQSERVTQAEGYAFQNGANDMPARVRGSEANERGAC